MEARIVGQFGVERCSQEMSLLRGDNPPVGDGSENLRPAADRLNDRRTDEYRVVRVCCPAGLLEFGDVQLGLERIQLTAKGIARYFDVHQTEQRLGAADILREEDRARAGTPNGVALAELAQWLHQAEVVREFTDGGGFAAGEDEAIQPFKMFGQAYLGGFHAETLEHGNVFGEIALNGKDTNFHSFF